MCSRWGGLDVLQLIVWLERTSENESEEAKKLCTTSIQNGVYLVKLPLG